MDIRLNAKLSAYGKVSPPKACSADTVTHEDIDSLFEKTNTSKSLKPIASNNSTVSTDEIDLLFNKR